MQTDPASPDPEERMNGVLSLCAGLIPLAGTVLGVAGIIFGLLGRRSESKRMAIAGVILSIIGVLTAIIYSILLYRAKYS